MSLPMDSDDFRPTASLEMLRLRSAVLKELRRFFEARGYWEVDTPEIGRAHV